ncbi:MAG: FlgD immunoglobulin-like domain containing protein [Candidatus Eiseniibacteriota bacterium]
MNQALRFAIPALAFALSDLLGPATLTVFDAAGRAVATLPAPAGATAVAWSGRDGSGAPVRSGLYFARLESAGVRRLTRIAVRR